MCTIGPVTKFNAELSITSHLTYGHLSVILDEL